jgi:hypothetical protein
MHTIDVSFSFISASSFAQLSASSIINGILCVRRGVCLAINERIPSQISHFDFFSHANRAKVPREKSFPVDSEQDSGKKKATIDGLSP